MPPEDTVKYMSPKTVTDMRLTWPEGYMRYQPVLYSKVAAFKQEWKVRNGLVGGFSGKV